MLNVVNLSVKYDASEDRRALSDVTFSVGEGERVALIGANGAGKSTLLLALVGILPLAEGTVEIGGCVLNSKTLPTLRRMMGLVFQNPDDQLFMPTVYDDIAFGPRNYGLTDDETEARVKDALERLGIVHIRERMSHQLSGGEKRLTALAGVLAIEPSVLLLDEPSSFLDPRARRRLIEALDSLKQAMLIATHDMDLAMKLCGRAILLKEGRVFADAPAREVLRNERILEECGL